MFVNLNQHNFFELFDIVLHEFENVNHDVNDIFNFND